VRGHRRSLGLIVSEITNPFFPEIVQTFAKLGAQHNYEILLSSIDHDPRLLERAARQMIERRVGGVAILTFGDELPLTDALTARNVPVFFVDADSSGPLLKAFQIDEIQTSATIRIMYPGEPFINTVAGELNNLVSAARPELETLDIDIQTNSPCGRDYTIWTGRFTKCWPGPTGFEQASVTISLNCMLPLKRTEIKDVEVDCHTIAEISQVGKSSRVRKDSRGSLLLAQLRSSGLQKILLEKIEWGRDLLMRSESWR
jgi:hypothetical protein